ncbi:MAG: glycosyltransferase family 4 protein [Candidatus Doudnabacteria bacterium]|nr:glycosyltransferase family 4 protein [Candidatus Doudnabacteria bacterium]
MRIGIDARTLTADEFTGVETYTINVIQQLLELGKPENFVLFSSGGKRNLNSRLLRLLPGKVNLKDLRIPNRLLNASLLFFAKPEIDRLLGKIDAFFSPRYLFGAYSAQCRLVVTIHDVSFVHFPEFFSRKQRLWHQVVSDHRACLRAQAVIVVSSSTRLDVAKFFNTPSKKIFTVPPGLDHRIFNTTVDREREERLRHKYQLSGDYIVYLGTIEPRKNVAAIIAAYEKFRTKAKNKVKLVLAGGLGWLYQDTLRLIKSSAVYKDISVLGYVEESFKPSLLRCAKVFVFPSYYEGFGFPPLEAMACGVPVIVAANSSFHEVLGNACLYVNPFDSTQLSLAIEAILSDPRLADELVQAGIARAQLFSWEKTGKGIIGVLRHVLEQQ